MPHSEDAEHNNDHSFGKDKRKVTIQEAKVKSCTRPFDLTGEVIEEIYTAQPEDLPSSCLPVKKKVARVLNREREKKFPES